MPRSPKALAGFATKTQALSAHLTELAHRLGPGARLPTMQQLSEELGISVMTLNRALSELEAQGIVVRRQGSGTYVGERIGQQNVALVYDREVFGPAASPFCALLLNHLQGLCEERGQKLSLFFAGSSTELGGVPEDLAEAVQARRVSGVLFAGESEPATLKWLQRQKVPVVALSYAPVTPFRVQLDHAGTVALGTRALASRGCQRIGLWIPAGVGIGPQSPGQSFPELEAYKTQLAEAGLPYDPGLVYGLDKLRAQVAQTPTATNQQQGLQAALDVFGQLQALLGATPDGLVILDDMMTSGALRGFSELGMVPGQDVQIATHANRGSSLLFSQENRLQLVEMDPEEIARAMVDLLNKVISGEKPAASVVTIGPHASQLV